MRYTQFEKKIKVKNIIDYGLLGRPIDVDLIKDNNFSISVFSIFAAIKLAKNTTERNIYTEIYKRLCKYYNQLFVAAQRGNRSRFVELLNPERIGERQGTLAKISPLGYGGDHKNNGQGLGVEKVNALFECFEQKKVNSPERGELLLRGVGPDTVSDLITNIISDILVDYTDNILQQFKVGQSVGDFSVSPFTHSQEIHCWDGKWKVVTVKRNIRFQDSNNVREQILIPLSLVLPNENYFKNIPYRGTTVDVQLEELVGDILLEELKPEIQKKLSIPSGKRVYKTHLGNFLEIEMNFDKFTTVESMIKIGNHYNKNVDDLIEKLIDMLKNKYKMKHKKI
ncbi:MAG: hypothetical protein ACRCV7_04280 [Culicoidibacterales bacterium]